MFSLSLLWEIAYIISLIASGVFVAAQVFSMIAVIFFRHYLKSKSVRLLNFFLDTPETATIFGTISLFILLCLWEGFSWWLLVASAPIVLYLSGLLIERLLNDWWSRKT